MAPLPLPTVADPPLAARPFPIRTRRDRLLAAIADVVADEGYAAVSVAKVAAAARMSRNSFYEHFSNKEECYLAAYDAAVAAVTAHVRAACPRGGSRQAGLIAGLGAFLRFCAGEPAFASLCMVEVLAAGPRALARRDAALGAFAAYLRDAGPESGAPAPDVLIEVLVGGVYEVVYARIVRGLTDTLPSLLPDVVHLWRAAHLAPATVAHVSPSPFRIPDPAAEQGEADEV